MGRTEEIKRSRQRVAENAVYFLIWLVVFLVTLVGFSIDGVVQWEEVGRFWLRAAPFFLLFLVNNYLLLPRFFLKKKYAAYVVSAFTAVLVVTAFHGMMFRQMKDRFPPHGTFPGDRPVREQMQGPPGEGPRQGGRFDADGTGSRGDIMRPGPPRPFPFKWGLLLNKFLLALLLAGFNIAVKLIFKTVSDARVMEELERQNLRAELDYLKVQINPHFFMNTLNNIHALVDIDGEKAKDTIIELSKIMRYVLYETDKPLAPLSQEVRFLENYISLMSIRYSGDVRIENTYPDNMPEGRIPPLMLSTLVENAFKHGISYRKDSFIRSELVVQGERLLYTVSNSRQDAAPDRQGSGVGLDNLRKRLGLLYGDRFRLKLVTRDGVHTALLEIPIEK
ncbi:MAG: histidine kinase [Alistipes sp.]|nr:histidine kinase [Alistipes sp.]